MSRLVVAAYSLAGACLAIVLSGAGSADFSSAHPWAAGWLAAGIITAPVGAFAYEASLPSRRWWLTPLACGIGLFVSAVGIVSYFVVAQPPIRNGFLYGLTILLALLRVWHKPLK